MENQPELAPPPSRNDTFSYLMTAAIFFALGLLVGYLVTSENNDSTESSSSNSGISVAQAVESTLIALTPTATPQPTVVPIQLTYSEDDYRQGSPDAPIKLVEFSDYRCPYCARFAAETLPVLMQLYDGYLEFVYRDYISFGEPSLMASQGAYCANEQEQFWGYHDLIFISQAQEGVEITSEVLTSFADTLELDSEQFNTCMNDQTVQDAILAKVVDAGELLGRAPTPTFLINGRRVVGAMPLENFIQIINEELEALGIEPPVS
jgi:protein-disulfide isomerase